MGIMTSTLREELTYWPFRWKFMVGMCSFSTGLLLGKKCSGWSIAGAPYPSYTAKHRCFVVHPPLIRGGHSGWLWRGEVSLYSKWFFVEDLPSLKGLNMVFVCLYYRIHPDTFWEVLMLFVLSLHPYPTSGNIQNMAILCGLFGMFKWPFQGLLVTSNLEDHPSYKVLSNWGKGLQIGMALPSVSYK